MPTDDDLDLAREWVRANLGLVYEKRPRNEVAVEVYAAGLAAGRVGPTWTGTPPTVADWYWWKSNKPGSKPVAVQMTEGRAFGTRFVYWPGKIGLITIREEDGQWSSGPIPTPSES